MLSSDQICFVREYFVDVDPIAAAERIGHGSEDAPAAARVLTSDATVAAALATVWDAILEVVRVHGRRVYDPLPKQNEKQACIIVRHVGQG